MAAPIVLGITIRANGSAQVTGELDRVRGSINGADSAAQNANRSFAAMARETLGLGSALKGLAAGLSVLAIYQSTKELIRLADTMTLLDSRIKIATGSQADYVSSSKELVAISLRTGTSFEANATIFSRINKAMEQMGGTTRNTTALTEALAQSLRISGTSAGEAASVIRQMSQALASGVLRGDEFNSLMENSPRLSQALADGMHVSIGALRAMAEAGELTSKRVITAIQSQSSVINEEFAKIPLTVGAAMENINTAFGQYVLEANKGSGATAGLAQSVNDLAKNLTPVLDGIVTLGKIAAAVFATQMAGSIATCVATYIAATRGAMAIESAHSAAIVQNTQVTIARAEATIIATASVTAYRAAQVSLSIAEEAAATSRLVLVDTSIAQSRATIAATSATVQSTAILYLNRQATQDLAIAQQARVGIIMELNVLGRQQTAMATQLTIAEEAQAAATAELAAAQRVATFSLTGFIAGLTLAGIAMAALSAATSIFIGLQLATYLNGFVAVQNAGASAANYLIKTMEILNYATEKAILLSKLDIDGARQLRIEHEASMASHDKITASIIAANNAIEKGSALTGDMAAALESLKTPQQVYNQSIKDATEASKTLDGEALKLDSTSKKMLITEEQRLAVGVKALEIWRQANAEEQNAKLSAAGKEAAKLQDQYDKLTLSPKDYNKQNAQSFSGSPEEIASVERLSNAILTLQESKKALTEDTKEQNSEAKKSAQAVKSLEDTYSSLTSAMAKSIALQGDATATIAMKYDVESGALSKLEHSQKLYLLQQTAILQNKELETKAHAAAKSELETLTDKYNQLTMSARNYYASTLDKKGIKPADQQPILAQFDKNSAIESSKAKFDESTAAVDAYNKSLTETSSKTADINNSTGTLLNGLSAGVNVMTAAFDNFTAKLKDNITATVALNTAKGANDTAIIELDRQKSLNVGLDTYDKKISALNKNKQLYALQEKSNTIAETKNQLNFVGQVANATAQMFKENTTARKAFSLVALAASIAERLQDIAGLTVAGAKATLNQGNGDPYSAFARMAAMAAAVGSILASVAGAGQSGSFNFAGGGQSVSAAIPSPDTGTVLGDPTAKSESIDKTYDLLKSIHADEYSELRGINSGVAALSGSITNVITRLFQAGGLSAAFILSPTMITGFAAMNLFPSLAAKIFGGKQTSSIIGQGLSTNATSLNSVMSGGDIGARQYANIETKTSGGWFGSDKYKNSVQYQAVDAATQDAMNDMFKSMGVTMTGLADALGGDLAARVRDYIIPAFTVELKGLSGEDAAKKLNGVISTALDTMSTAVFGDIIGQYQKLGEGMLETAVRIVSEVAVVKDALATSGLSLANNAIAIGGALVQAAGGLSEFQKQFEAYFDKFYTDSEKQAASYKSLTSSMLDVLYVLPKTREEYRKYLESLNLNDALDQKRYSMMLKLSAAADSYYTALDAQTKVYTDAIATAKSNLAAAYKTESDAITGTISKMTGFIDSLKNFSDTLSVGALAPGGAATKASNVNGAFYSNVDAIKKGYGTTTADNLAFTTAIGSLQSNAANFLTNSMATSSSASQYAKDYNSVQAAIALGISKSEGVKNTSQLQLDALNTSVTGLIDIKTAVYTVTDGVKGVVTAVSALAASEAARIKIEQDAAAAVVVATAARAVADAAAAQAAQKAAKLSIYSGWSAAQSGESHGGAQHQADYVAYISAATGMSSFDSNLSVAQYQALNIGVSKAVSSLNWVFSEQNKGTGWRNAEGSVYIRQIQEYANRIKSGDLSAHVAGTAHIPGFATGGAHTGGFRIVGENGPEIEATGPSHIFSNSQSKSLVDNSELIAKMEALIEEVSQLRQDARAQNSAIAEHTKNTVKQLFRWDIDGIPVKTYTPINVKVTV